MTKKTPKELLTRLSERELEVLQWYCQHKAQKEIGKILNITKNTVKTHISNICVKLEIETSDPGERKLIFFNSFCPLISEDDLDETPPLKQAEINKPTPENIVEENDSKTEEIKIEKQGEEIIPEDQTSKNGEKEKMGTKKKRGCRRFLFTLILGALLLIGALFAWENYLKEMPIVQTIVELINPDAVIESSSSAPSTSGSSSSESIIKSILPKSDKYADAYEVGEWAKQDDVWVRLFDYEVSRGLIRLDFEVWNKTGQDIYFSWSPEQTFSMTDNKNNRYEVFTASTREVSVESDERLHFTGHGYSTVQFEDDPLFESGVSDLYVTMEYLSKIDEAVFHILVGN
ncbi:MAG: helix-turn-helix transcriptional regulator [Anaerolineales bacterium]|nr:helix-turn-helix transcriptional regulator [Anaerolineales bacterium]